MHKFLSYMTLISLFFTNFSFINEVKASDDENYFIVTAYYSPLPDQKSYLRGNYEDEKKLNGEGINGASGKKVFIGMLAAPKSYSFGTKIQLEGLGVGEVSDRGGAIVQAGNRGYEYDRIDIWMGYSDEGLKRALKWGKRKVKGKIVDKNTNVDLDYTKNAGTKYVSPKVEIQKTQIIDTKTSEKIIKEETEKESKNIEKKEMQIKTKNNIIITKKQEVKQVSIFETNKLDGKQILELSKKLKELSIYNGDETSNYKDLIVAIANYQIKKGFIKDENDIAAGYYGPKTRAGLKADYEALVKQKEKKAKQELEEKNRILALEKEMQNLKNLANNESNKKIDSIGYPKFSETSKNVRELQLTLKQLGFFNEKDTAIFGPKTKQAIYNYQISKGLVSKPDDLGAGMIGPKTAAAMKADLANIYLSQKIQKNKQVSETKNNKNISNSLNIISL